MYKLCVYVPEKHVETVKKALFNVGAGHIGQYDQCCWQMTGVGQFRPLENSNPAIGSHNVVETVNEVKIELVCEDALIQRAVAAIKQSHPYEEPAYDVWKLEDL